VEELKKFVVKQFSQKTFAKMPKKAILKKSKKKAKY
jgi:hypothetical protein